MPRCGKLNRDGTKCGRNVAPCWQHRQCGIWQAVSRNRTLGFILVLTSLSMNVVELPWGKLAQMVQPAPITKAMLEAQRG
jgi:hypothetical protein